jgi:putative PEP-CTERM system TPR-repeat lipoprotein
MSARVNATQGRRWASILAVAAVVAACSGDDPAKQLEAAKVAIQRDDNQTAIIHLKSALQSNPDNPEARFLLGKALLAAGDGSSAVVEFRKALQLKHPETATFPELARAMYLTKAHQAVVEQFGTTTLGEPLAHADLKTTVALAQAAQGRRTEALAALEAALRSTPDHAPARLLEARLKAAGGDIDGALATVQTLLDRAPSDHQAWHLRGDLLRAGNRDVDTFMQAYRKALELRPDFLPAHSAILAYQLTHSQLDAAKEQLAKLKAALPKHPQGTYFEAALALRQNELPRAQDLVQQLLRMAPDEPKILLMAGSVALEQKSFLQAETHLSKALNRDPQLDAARRLLGLTYLQFGQPNKALVTLQPLLERPNPGAAEHSLVARAHAQLGELAAAEAAFAKAAALSPGDSRARAALAVSKFLQGDTDTGLADLERLAANPADPTADVPLISALVRERNFDGALKAIDTLEKKTSDQPLAPNLRGRVLAQLGRIDEAKTQFERALKIKNDFYPARNALAQIALREGRREDAEKLLQEALSLDPRNTHALLALAGVKSTRGAELKSIVADFERAIQTAPTSPAPRVGLVNFLISRNDFKSALDVAQRADSEIPNTPDVIDALGRAQAEAGNRNQALTTFGRLVQLVPQSPLPHVRIADVHWKAQDRAAATESLKRALSVAPDNLHAQRTLVDAYVAQGKFDAAVDVAREVQKQRPAEDAGYLFEGGVLASQARWERAIEVYRRGLKGAPGSAVLAARLFEALIAGKQEALATRHAGDWLRANPADVDFRFFLGDFALQSGDLAAAETHYRAVLKQRPDNALAMNNLAWLMTQAKKPGAAELARQADRLLPGKPSIMDTLATALAAEGKPREAVEVMRKALVLDGKNPQLRLSYARLLIETGDKAAARNELSELAKLGDKFSSQDQVKLLLSRL